MEEDSPKDSSESPTGSPSEAPVTSSSEEEPNMPSEWNDEIKNTDHLQSNDTKELEKDETAANTADASEHISESSEITSAENDDVRSTPQVIINALQIQIIDIHLL